MAEISKALEIPYKGLETTTWAVRTMAGEGFSALRSGGNLARRALPGYIPPDEQEQQAILRDNRTGLGVAAGLLDPDLTGRELNVRAAETADSVAQSGLTEIEFSEGEGETRSIIFPLVELRLLLPGDVLRNPAISRRYDMILGLMRGKLAERGIASVPSPPIVPVEHEHETAEPRAVWGSLAAELDLLGHQMDREKRNPKLLTLTGPEYAADIFPDQIIPDDPAEDDILGVENVGEQAEEVRLGRRRIFPDRRSAGRRISGPDRREAEDRESFGPRLLKQMLSQTNKGLSRPSFV